MGVKGLSSYLSTEPTRFGRQRIITKGDNVQIYIDMPALHHHFIDCFQKRASPPPSFNMRDLDMPTTGICSPCTVFKLTLAFFRHLLKTISVESKIYCVFDGMASDTKQKQQIERMTVNCTIFDEAARLFVNGEERGKRFHVPHLFGEEAMCEALETLALEDINQDRISIHFADFEAETYISDIMNAQDSVIFSNDSDFLVYPKIQSFMPFHSIEYSILSDGSDSIMGWEYTKNQFLAAHTNLLGINYEDSLLIMTTVAALAGCDYTLEPSLQRRIASARNIVVKSNVGGLRQRDRNDPSAKNTLISVIRYVSHFRRSNDEKWMLKMADKIALEEGRKDATERASSLVEALYAINQIYAGKEYHQNDNTLQKSGLQRNLAEIFRILNQQKFYCKPMLEVCQRSKTEKQKRGRGRGKKKGQKKASNEENVQDRRGLGSSLWMKESFVECRDRLYGFILGRGDKGEAGNGDTSFEITELCRSGISDQVTFKKYTFEISPWSESLPKEMSDVLLNLMGNESISSTDIDRLGCRQKFILYACLLLESQLDVIILLVVSLAPRGRHRQKEYHTLMHWQEFVQCNARLVLSLYHAQLAIDSVNFLSSVNQDSILPSISLHQIFCDERFLVAWEILSETMAKDTSDLLLDDFDLEFVKSKWNRAFKTDSRDWTDTHIDNVWNLWKKAYSKSHNSQ